MTRDGRGWPLVVRRARPGDMDAVLGFASRTWNDWDYIPHAWPRWLEERDGVMLVGAKPDGTPVAIVRVAMPAAGEGWLEGIRVDPAARGMSVATDLQVAELHWAAANGATVVRYATGARNEGSHRLGARGGFGLVATLRGAWWSASGDPGADDRPESAFLAHVQDAVSRRRRALLETSAAAGLVAPPEVAGRIWHELELDPSFGSAGRLYEARPWALEELTGAKLIDHARRGELLALPGDRFAVAILVGQQPPAEDSALRLALLMGAPDAAFELVERLRALAGESIRFRYGEGAPMMAGVEQRYADAGYVFPDWALHVLARPLDAEHPAPPLDASKVVMADSPEPSITPAQP